MASEPVSAFDVAGEIGCAAFAVVVQDDCGLVRVRGGRIGEFGGIAHEAGDDGEYGIVDRLQGNAILRSGDPVGIYESV